MIYWIRSAKTIIVASSCFNHELMTLIEQAYDISLEQWNKQIPTLFTTN